MKHVLLERLYQIGQSMCQGYFYILKSAQAI
jgi:hypothetical protein